MAAVRKFQLAFGVMALASEPYELDMRLLTRRLIINSFKCWWHVASYEHGDDAKLSDFIRQIFTGRALK